MSAESTGKDDDPLAFQLKVTLKLFTLVTNGWTNWPNLVPIQFPLSSMAAGSGPIPIITALSAME